MEDVVKALFIAAGLFLAVLLLSLLAVFYDEVSIYYKSEQEVAVREQAQKFNVRFQNYDRENIRGSDLISLMNRVIDYNATEAYFEEKGYDRIVVKIDMGTELNLDEFKYDEDSNRNNLLKQTITNSGTGNNWVNDRSLVEIASTPTELCEELSSIGVINPKDTQLQLLSSKISNIILSDIEENSNGYENVRLKRAKIIKDILNIEISVDENTGKTTDTFSANIIQKIKDITDRYYQYTKFKRAVFDCTGMTYSKGTKRVVSMEFKLKIGDDNKVVFD